MARVFRPETTIVGVSLIALGVLWTLANLGSLDMLTTIRTWWPLSLILWGGLELYGWLVTRSTGGPR